MIVALDNSFLTLILNEKSKPRVGPSGKPTENWRERIDGMIARHSSNSDVLLIPTPCLAEALMAVPNIARALDLINESPTMQFGSFDAKAAIELGTDNSLARQSGDKKSGSVADWQKVKFDKQIAAIAKTSGAEIFYTDDDDQAHFAERLGLKVVHSWELPLPPDLAQPSLGF